MKDLVQYYFEKRRLSSRVDSQGNERTTFERKFIDLQYRYGVSFEKEK